MGQPVRCGARLRVAPGPTLVFTVMVLGFVARCDEIADSYLRLIFVLNSPWAANTHLTLT